MIETYSPGFLHKNAKLALNNDLEVKGLVQISIFEFGLRVYSTRYTERNTKINIECPQ